MNTDRHKIQHYRRLYGGRPDPIQCFHASCSEHFGTLVPWLDSLVLLVHSSWGSYPVIELPEESGQFRFLCDVSSAHLKGSVGLILANASTIRVSMWVHSSRPLHSVLHSTSSIHPLSTLPLPSRSFPRTPLSTICLWNCGHRPWALNESWPSSLLNFIENLHTRYFLNCILVWVYVKFFWRKKPVFPTFITPTLICKSFRINIPTIPTPAFSCVFRFHCMCCPEEVSELSTLKSHQERCLL